MAMSFEAAKKTAEKLDEVIIDRRGRHILRDHGPNSEPNKRGGKRGCSSGIEDTETISPEISTDKQ